jgi:hypothetical protein
MARRQINTRSIEGAAFIVKPEIFAAFKYIFRAIYFLTGVREVLDWLDSSSYTNCDEENIFKKELIYESNDDSTDASNDSSVPHNDYENPIMLFELSNQPSGLLGDGPITEIVGTRLVRFRM